MLFVPNWIMLSSGIATIFGGLLTLLFAGGFRFVLHQKGLEVQFGTLSIPLKRIPTEEITGYELKGFNALADYGGLGRQMGPGTTPRLISSQVMSDCWSKQRKGTT